LRHLSNRSKISYLQLNFKNQKTIQSEEFRGVKLFGRKNKNQIVFACEIVIIHRLAFDKNGVLCHLQLLVQINDLHFCGLDLIRNDSLISVQSIKLQEGPIHQKACDGEGQTDQQDFQRLVQQLHMPLV
jgi:hypothetical protein